MSESGLEIWGSKNSFANDDSATAVTRLYQSAEAACGRRRNGSYGEVQAGDMSLAESHEVIGQRTDGSNF